MIRLHYQYLFNVKTRIVPIGFMMIFMILIFVNSNLFESAAYIESDLESNLRLYLFDSITAFMLLDVILIELVVIHAFIMNWYDIQLISRQARKSIVISKVIVMILYTVWIVSMMVLTIGIFGEIRGYQMHSFILKFSAIAFLFHIYYLLLTTYLALKFQTIWHTMIPVVGFLMSFIFTSEESFYEENLIFKTLQAIFPTILFDPKLIPVFLYGSVIVFSVLLGLFLVIIRTYQAMNLS